MRFRLSPRRRPRARRTRRGISLIEIMISMTLLGLIMMSMGRMSLAVSQRGRTNDVIARRTFALQQQASKFGTMPFDSIATFPTTPQTMVAGTFRYRRRLTITSPSTNRRQIVVVVVPLPDTTMADSLVIDRSRSANNTPLCGGCP